LLPRPCTSSSWGTTTSTVVRRGDGFMPQMPAPVAKAAVSKKIPPITSNFKRVDSLPKAEKQAAETPTVKTPDIKTTDTKTIVPETALPIEAVLRKAAKEGDNAAFCTIIQKKPALLNQKDPLGKTPLDYMPESRRKTELYGRVKHLLKDDVLIWESAKQGD